LEETAEVRHVVDVSNIAPKKWRGNPT